MGLVSTGEKSPWCGGSILTILHILTAAHCTYDSSIDSVKAPSSIQVLVGEHDISDSVADIHTVSMITNHPKFNHDNADYDFSIMTLTSLITFSSKAAPICLPASVASLYTGQVATVTGWGDTGADGSPASTLQEVDVLVQSNDKCNDYYPGKIKE